MRDSHKDIFEKKVKTTEAWIAPLAACQWIVIALSRSIFNILQFRVLA